MALNKLSSFTVTSLVRQGSRGRTGDGGGLWLDVRGPGRAAWVFRYSSKGSARELGLGSAKDIELAAARLRAAEHRKALAGGQDPLDLKEEAERAEADARNAAQACAASEAMTFERAAELRIAAKEAEYRNAKHLQQWRATLKTYAYPHFGSKPVGDVSREDVLAALSPIWLTKPETAARTRQRIEAVLDYAAAHGWREGANPAAWRGQLSHLLASPAKTRRVRHHPALPWKDLPAFMGELRSADGMGALALRFAILTAARSGEVRGATWGELDLAANVWTLAGMRMKAGRQHRVPLSAEALNVIAQARPFKVSDDPGALVFPSSRQGKPLSDMTLAAVIKRFNKGVAARWNDVNGAPAVVHGFRSSFRDWCADTRPEPAEVVEQALAHTIRNATEAAYRRGDLLERRVALMDAWAQHCWPSVGENVHPIAGSQRRL